MIGRVPKGDAPIIDVTNLTISLGRGSAAKTIVDNVNFSLYPGEILGLVGESGSGKSITALSLIRLLPRGMHATGSIRLGGIDLLGLNDSGMAAVRGARIAMIFQEPSSALNPTFTIGVQIETALQSHHKLTRTAARARTIELLTLVGFSEPEKRINFYPHQLSGGMCQRVMIAMALAGGANLLVADEPTTALDVTIQEEIVCLLEDLRSRTGLSVIFISHDLGLIAQLCDRVAVMYAGEIVEIGDTDYIIREPRHPYTRRLMAAVPDMTQTGRLLRGIPGTPPMVGAWPAGCRFQPRCDLSAQPCSSRQTLISHGLGSVRCCRAEVPVEETISSRGSGC